MSIQRIASPLAVLSAAAPAHPVAACALSVALGDDLVRLIPAGQFSAPRGALSGSGPWHLDEAQARRIIMMAATRGADIVIDYDHQTLLTETNGKPAPASGWIDPKSLEWRPDGLYGHIRWTAAAKAAIAPGPDGEPPEYRYLSPVFPYDAESGAVLDLLHLALTNNPAISDGDAVLAAARRAYAAPQQEQEEGSDVNREELILALGLAADATDEQIKAGIAALKASSEQALALRQALAIGDDEEPVAAVAALKAKADKPASAEPDLSQYVPKAVYVEATQQLAALKAGGDTAELDRMIDEGLKDGRIPGKATADWLRGQGIAACKAHLEGAPSIAALKATQTDGKAPEADAKGKDGLTATELAVCKSMGISPEAYRKANPVDDE